MKTDLNYSPMACFQTFPFPEPSPATNIPEVGNAGEALYSARGKHMASTGCGLTTTYNELRDPENRALDIEQLRRLHENLDRTVLDAYGWHDIEVPTYSHIRTRTARAQRENFENEVIDRLFALNAGRAVS